MRKIILFFLITILSQLTRGQDFPYVRIPNSPATEVYDLLEDSKGYLWLGHYFGITRFDGHNFISFTNPRQNALSMTDLCEDSAGRIWCHNFSGQIFFISKLKLNLLNAYRFEDEPSFPRTGLCGNDMVATSAKGLFVLNTKTFESKYYLMPGGTTSLAVLRDRVLLFGNGNWYIWQHAKGISKVEKMNFAIGEIENIVLQPKGIRDTAYCIQNPEGYYYKILLTGDSLCLCKKVTAKGFINAITTDHDQAWIHSKLYSAALGGQDSINGQNLTDMVRDENGNSFVSSLKNGLALKFSTNGIKRVRFSFIGKNDFIRKTTRMGDNIVCGTQYGKIYLLSSDFNLLAAFSLPDSNIAIEQLFSISKNAVIVGTTIGMFLADFSRHKLVLLDKNIIVKDLDIARDTVFLATTRNLLSIPLNQLLNHQNCCDSSLQFTVLKPGRARAVACCLNNGRIFLVCSFIDGIYQWQADHRVGRLSSNDQQIYASAIRVWNNKMIIGTFNQGIFIIENEKIRNITTRDGLLSNSVKNIKRCVNGIWIISFSGLIQKMNEQLDFINTRQTSFNSALLQDIEEVGQKIYVATNPEMYNIESGTGQAHVVNTSIDYVLINGKDTAGNSYVFSNEENNLQLNLSTPFFNPFCYLRYKYRFYNIQNTEPAWQVSEDEQRAFTLLGLRPGKYVFEAVAINPLGQAVSLQVKQVITVTPAWYQTNWFRIISFVLFCAVLFAISRMLILYPVRKKQATFEKRLAIQNERQRISFDLHDDIGSALSSVNIYAELAKDAVDKSFYLDSIGKNIRDVVGKLDDLVWSISPRNETWESVAEKVKDFAQPVVALKSIALTISIDEFLKKIKATPEIKHHVYMISKELINNAIKHSGCTRIDIQFAYSNRFLQLTVTDNGKGFRKDNMRNRNGLQNISIRAREMKGSIEIGPSGSGGTLIKLQVPL